jgi:hypothetical protein
MTILPEVKSESQTATQSKMGRLVLWTAIGLIVLIVSVFVFFCRNHSSRESDVTPARLVAQGKKLPFVIKARAWPIQLKPIHGLEDCVTDEQLAKALHASLPFWHPPSVPSLVHELKLWGKDSVFTKEQVGGEGRTGKMMVETLLSDSYCADRTVILGEGKGGSYLIDSPYGIHPIQSGSYDAVEYRAESHYGKITMLMGLTNIPLSSPVTSSSGNVGSLADILQDTVMNFHWGQELEFIGCSLAFWLPPENTWTNQFDETFTFDDLMERLLEQPLGKGCCGGCHVPYTVVTLLRVDAEHSPILSKKTRGLAEQWLKKVVATLEQNQLPDGGWERDWGKTGQDGLVYDDQVLDRITIVGHHLEWIAMAPEEFRPSQKFIQDAVVSVTKQIDLLPPLYIRSFKTVLPCSHAAKAMCLMRNVDSFRIWLNLTTSKEVEE